MMRCRLPVGLKPEGGILPAQTRPGMGPKAALGRSSLARPMSLVGYLRTFHDVRHMFALPPESGHSAARSECPLSAAKADIPPVSPRWESRRQIPQNGLT